MRHSKRLKAALAPLAVRLLQLGVPVVFDFAGNTPNDRAWVRSIFESANADHVLHYIVASDESCKARLRLRNETKPEGVYFGFVSEDRFDEVTRFHAAIRSRKLPCDLSRNRHPVIKGIDASGNQGRVPNRLCAQLKDSIMGLSFCFDPKRTRAEGIKCRIFIHARTHFARAHPAHHH